MATHYAAGGLCDRLHRPKRPAARDATRRSGRIRQGRIGMEKHAVCPSTQLELPTELAVGFLRSDQDLARLPRPAAAAEATFRLLPAARLHHPVSLSKEADGVNTHLRRCARALTPLQARDRSVTLDWIGDFAMPPLAGHLFKSTMI